MTEPTDDLVPAATETAVRAVWSAPTQSALREAAREMDQAGLCVVRVRGDGTKRPEGSWKALQASRSSSAALARQFPPGDAPAATYGVGVVCGSISGNLLMIEFEGAAVKEGWLTMAAQTVAAHPDPAVSAAWDAVMGGWVEESPSGGLHLHVRVTGGPCPGNIKIASRELRIDEMDARQLAAVTADPARTFPKTMIETRGEGGFAVRAPSGGSVHPSGWAYTRVHGSPADIPEVPAEAVSGLLSALEMLNVYVAPAHSARPAGGRTAARVDPSDGEGLSPFEDFNERADWETILDGILFRSGTAHDGIEQWTRLGKDPADGHSATIGFGGDLLHVFSSSVGELPTGQSMNKAQVYTWLRFGSIDSAACSKAAKELRASGYGFRPQDDDPLSAEAVIASGGRDLRITRIPADPDALVQAVTEASDLAVETVLRWSLTALKPMLRTDRSAVRAAVDRIGQAALERGLDEDDIRQAVISILVQG